MHDPVHVLCSHTGAPRLRAHTHKLYHRMHGFGSVQDVGTQHSLVISDLAQSDDTAACEAADLSAAAAGALNHQHACTPVAQNNLPVSAQQLQLNSTLMDTKQTAL